MSELLKKLMESNEIIDNVTGKLVKIDKMLIDHDNLQKIVPKYAGFIYDDSVEVVTIFQNDNVTITYGVWRKKDTSYPFHCHNESNEYLIVINGSFNVDLEGENHILTKGQELFVPMNKMHGCTALEINSEMFGICIPPEKAYLREKG
jgi:quercetin dioxygenase-like cupin family protein